MRSLGSGRCRAGRFGRRQRAQRGLGGSIPQVERSARRFGRRCPLAKATDLRRPVRRSFSEGGRRPPERASAAGSRSLVAMRLRVARGRLSRSRPPRTVPVTLSAACAGRAGDLRSYPHPATCGGHPPPNGGGGFCGSLTLSTLCERLRVRTRTRRIAAVVPRSPPAARAILEDSRAAQRAALPPDTPSREAAAGSRSLVAIRRGWRGANPGGSRSPRTGL